MAELTKKQKKLLEELTGGTYKAPSEQRREKRDANLRKQQAEADIAPVKTTNDNKKWYQKIVKGSDAFDNITAPFKDGYQFGDITKTGLNTVGATTKTILGTGADVGLGLVKGVAQTGEGIGKLIAGGVAQVSDWVGQDEYAEKVRRNLATKDAPVSSFLKKQQDKVEGNSVIGGTGDKVSEAIGYIGSIWASGGAGTGVMFSSGSGNALQETYQKAEQKGENVEDWQVWTKSLGTGLIETATEKLGGFFGTSGFDTKIINKIIPKISSGAGKVLTKLGVQASTESFEEFLSYAGSQGLDYMIDVANEATGGDGMKLKEDWNWEEVGEQMAIAFMASGVLGGAGAVSEFRQNQDLQEQGNIPTAEDIQAQQTQEIEAQIEEKTAELEASEDVREQQIIQEELGILQEELVQETPVEDLKQKSFTYEATENDSDYKKAVYESANQVMNDTEASHKLADVVAKISEEKQTKYKFTNNAQLKELGYNIEGKTVNGLVNEDGEVLINVESAKFINRVIGHETTHLLEGTKEYDDLKAMAIEFAKTTGEYQTRMDSLNSIYEGRDADIEAELTADIVGDYLFNNEQFVQELSVQKPTIFQKIKNLISDLVVKFKGTKQEKQLRELQRKFEKAYQTTDARVSETSKNVISKDNQGRKLTSEQESYFKDSKVRDKDGNLLAVYHGTRGDFNVFETERTGQNYEGGYSSLGRGSYFTSDIETAKKFGEDSANEGDLNIKETYIDIKNPFYTDLTKNDSKVLEEIKEKYGIKEAEMFDGYNVLRILRINGVDTTDLLQEYGYDGIIGDGEYVVFDSKQVKNVDNAKPTESKDIRYSLSEDTEGNKGFYSQLENVITSKMQNSAKASDVLNLIKNNGVKQDELDWTGIEDYLKEKGNEKVTKQEIQDYIKANQLEIEDVTLGNEEYQRYENDRQKAKDIYYEADTALNDYIQNIKVNNGVEGVELFDSSSFAHQYGISSFRNGDNTQTVIDTLNKVYSRLTGYSETEITVSEAEAQELIKLTRDYLLKQNEYQHFMNGDNIDEYDMDSLPQYKDYRTKFKGGKNYREVLFRLPSEIANRRGITPFHSNHWERSNILAHTRLQDYTDSEGNNVLFVEEIQSDLHQEGRKKGYEKKYTQEERNALLEKYHTAREKYERLRETSNNKEEIAIAFQQYAEATGEVERFNEKNNLGGIDNQFPFKKNWQEFTLRKIINEAVQKGYDKVAWTTGEQQAERYDLSKQIDKIKWSKHPTEDSYWIRAYKIDNHGEYVQVIERDEPTKNLEDLLGREIASKIINSTDTDGELMDTDLKVGGEGMKGFYDKIIPEYLTKYLKKWGVSLETVTIDGNTQLGFRITPEMRESIQRTGQPLYSLSNEGEQDIAPTGDFDISSEDIKLQVQEAIAPMQEIVTELVEQMKTIVPTTEQNIENNVAPVQDVKTEINKNGVQMSVGEQVRTFNNSVYEVTDFFTTDDGITRVNLRNDKGYETSIAIDTIAENLSDSTKNNVSTRIENDSLQSSEAVETQNTEAFDNITDEDAPSFEDLSDVFDEVGETDVAPTMPSPLENRDIDEVGSKKVKAYQYEHPEIRPYFQYEAENMLYDLDNTVKGEKIVTQQLNPVTGLYENAEWTGTTRQTAEAIAYLKDKYGYSYDEIRKGLNAIIEDHGAENIAVAKRIEFMLDERLREGYTTADGIEIPANEDYIKFLEEQGITAYNLENFNAITDEDAPIEEAPVVEEVTTPPETNENMPTIENVEEVVKDVAPVQNIPENPNMDVTEGKQRRWAKTSTDAESIRDEIQLDDLDVKKITYMPITNRDTLGKVNKKIETKGYDEALKEFKATMTSGKSIKAEDTTLGQRLIQEALKRGDKDTAIDLLQDITILGTEIGQAVQSLSIIQRMTPTGQLKMLEKTVNRAKAKGNKAFEDVVITKEMKKKIMDSYNEGEITYDQDKLNRTMDEVKQELANQIKATKLDKVNAWRYLAMLGNPKTHIRNLVSNVAMFGTTEVKNAVARTIETVAPVKERTKTWKDSSEEVKNFANQTAMEMKEIISGDNKYNDETGIKALARTFETEVLEKAYNFNSDLLEKEDWWFSGARFKKALSEFLTANDINTEEDIFLNPELVEKAKTYALEQSRIATFRQYSYLANKIREVENKNTATNIVVGSILPFKKTPINIAKTGLAYSPLGFAKTLTYDISQVKKGNMEASTLIDNLSQNATGTALALAGYMLAMSGFLSGAGGDDEEAKYDYQLGKQSYAVNIGGKSYSLSWLSPVAMPLFVGANAYSQLVEKEEWNGDVVVEALGQTLDPLNEMSFVSGLVDILSSYENNDTLKLWGMVEAMGQNYATQLFPTLGSQIAGTLDDSKRTTKIGSDSEFKFVDETINKIKYKIPFLRETLEPSTDIWGNEVKQTENVLQRALENFIAPYSAKESTATEIDENIKSVFSATGDSGVIPNVPRNTIKFNNETYKMSAEEYTTFKKTYGQTANDLLEDLFRTTSYKQAGADEKAEMINEVYSYSSDIAKKQHLAKENVTYTNTTEDGEKVYKENTIKEAIKHDMTKEEYSLYSNDPEEYEFLEGKDSSYKRKYFNTQKSISDIEKTFNKRKDTIEAENMDEEEYDEAMEELSNEKKKSVVNKIINSGLEDTEKASLYKRYYNSDTVDTIVKSSINVDDYLTYTATEFKADYKSNGKVISGSRKKKVIEYVDSLDMDIPQKAILIKSTNTFKFNDYNNEIVEYVDTLNITLDEKKSILKDLDMTIDDDGYVYWD